MAIFENMCGNNPVGNFLGGGGTHQGFTFIGG